MAVESRSRKRMTSRSAPRRGDAAELAMRRDVTMSRRSFMRSLSALSVTAGAGLDLAARQTGTPASSTGVRVDAARLRARLEALSAFGRPGGGTFAGGV